MAYNPSTNGAKGTGIVSSGAENIATYPKLKDQLAQQNLASIATQDSRLAAAVNGGGTANPNFSVGRGTAAEADQLGRIWVGDGLRKLLMALGGTVLMVRVSIGSRLLNHRRMLLLACRQILKPIQSIQ